MIVSDVALSTDFNDAALSLAVLAGINAADALCLSRLGRHAHTRSHHDAISYLRECGPAGDNVARQLQRLLDNKSKAQYSIYRCTPTEARDAYRRAERIVGIVRLAVAASEGERGGND